MKNAFLPLLAAILLVPSAVRAAEAELISSLSVASMHNADGSVNNGAFGGGPELEALFDGATTPGSYIGPNGRAQNGCYVLLDFSSVKPGGYFVTDIAVSQVNAYAYSVYWSSNGTTWTPVEGGTNVTQVGTSTFGVNNVATHVKLVIDKVGGWTQTISEFQVWGLDPADVGCQHPSFTEWEDVSGSATCTEFGTARRKCLVCGETFERAAALPLGHDWETHLDTPGSSSSYGSGTLVCSRCGESIVFNVPLDLPTLGGVAFPGVVQFTDLSVSSSASDGGGTGPYDLIDNNWTWDWAAYWFASTRSESEYVQYDFGTEIDLTKIEWSAPNHALTLKFYKWDGENEEPLVEIPVTKDNTNNGYQRGSMEFRGVAVKGIRLHIADPTGIGYNGISPVGLSELHPYGTVVGAGKLDATRTRIFLY